MKIHITAVGKMREKRLTALFDEYYKRLKRYIPADHLVVKESKGEANLVKSAEAKALLSAIPQGAVVIALDERGDDLTSLELSQYVEKLMVRGTKNVCFCIGGADGLTPEFRDAADRVIRLSALTLTHEFARVLLAEQLYRAMTIIRGEPYHK